MREKPDELIFTTRRQTRPGRLLDRLDRTVAKAGRAIWLFLVDGFAAYGMAECGMYIDCQFDQTGGQNSGHSHALVGNLVFAVLDSEDLEGDFDNIDDLIKSVQLPGNSSRRISVAATAKARLPVQPTAAVCRLLRRPRH